MGVHEDATHQGDALDTAISLESNLKIWKWGHWAGKLHFCSGVRSVVCVSFCNGSIHVSLMECTNWVKEFQISCLLKLERGMREQNTSCNGSMASAKFLVCYFVLLQIDVCLRHWCKAASLTNTAVYTIFSKSSTGVHCQGHWMLCRGLWQCIWPVLDL